MRLRLLIVLLLCICGNVARAQARLDLNPSLGDFYGSLEGYGLGGWATLKAHPEKSALLVGRIALAQRSAQGGVWVVSEPQPWTGFFTLVGGHIHRSDERRFYGLNSNAPLEDRVRYKRTSGFVEARAGYVLPNLPLTLMASLRHRSDHAFSLYPEDLPALERQSEAAQRLFWAALDAMHRLRIQSLEVVWDNRNARDRPTQGMLVSAGWDWGTAQASSAAFTRLRGGASLFVPLRHEHGLRLWALGATTPRAEGTLPIFAFPQLDSELIDGLAADRYRGRDVVAGGVEVYFPIVRLLGIVGGDARVGLSVVGIYENLAEQISPRFSLQSRVEDVSDVPLRPVFHAGGRLFSLLQDKMVIEAGLGVSPDGLGLVFGSISADPRDFLPHLRP